MSLNASAKSGTVSTPAPAGAHIARCVRVVDLGTQITDGQYGVKVQPKLMLTWELPNELHIFKEENGPEPFVVSQEYTLSLGEKAKLRAHLQSWRGKPFTNEELEGFDVSKLAGVPCTLNIIHAVSATNGNTYANIASIAPMMKGLTCPPAILPVIVYDIAEKRSKKFETLPEWVRNKIANCNEWKAGESQAADADQASHSSATEPDPTDLHDEPMPF